MTELSDIKEFLSKVHTSGTVKTISDLKNINKIDATSRLLVHEGEFIFQDGLKYEKRFRIEIQDSSESNLISALSNIINGVDQLNRRKTITDYTKPSDLVRMDFVAQGKTIESKKGNFWYTNVFLDVTWVIT